MANKIWVLRCEYCTGIAASLTLDDIIKSQRIHEDAYHHKTTISLEDRSAESE